MVSNVLTNDQIHRSAYDFLRTGASYDTAKQKFSDIKNQMDEKQIEKTQEGLDKVFTKDKFNLLQKIANNSTFQEFYAAVTQGDLPPVQLNSTELELISGGKKNASMGFALSYAGSLGVSILTGGAGIFACAGAVYACSGCIGDLG